MDNKQHKTNQQIFYEGKLLDDQNSKVSGSIIDGVFYGTIKTENGKYHVESSKRYKWEFKSHSIIYHEDDILMNNTMKKRDLSYKNPVGCGTEKVMEWMKKVQKEAYDQNIKSTVIINTF